jgi:acyl-[acyl-carrier-protein] desaturase
VTDRDVRVISELAPIVARLLERHLESAREWFPHEMVPWSRGRDFEAGGTWDPDEFPLPAAVRSALFVNLLTEDNLPYYTSTLQRVFEREAPEGAEAWGVWTRRWTAEEMRHAMVMRDWLVVSRALDPWELERARMIQVGGGLVPDPVTVEDGLVYVTIQELATQISHRNVGRLLDDRPGSQIMGRVAGDEHLHHVFYRDLATAAFDLDASSMVMALERQVRGFEMPGTGIPGFDAHAKVISSAGIYDFALHHTQILVPLVIDHWKLDALEGLSPEADQARSRTLKHVDRVGIAARRLRASREREAVRVGV